MCSSLPHADDELQTFPVIHPVSVRDLDVLVEERDITLRGTGERFQSLHPGSDAPKQHKSSLKRLT